MSFMHSLCALLLTCSGPAAGPLVVQDDLKNVVASRLLAVPGRPQPTDADLLQGDWRVVAAESHSPNNAKRWMGATLTFRGNGIRYVWRDTAPHEEDFVLDPTKAPKEIDFYNEDAFNLMVLSSKGIYAFEKGRLRLFYRATGQPRPTTFEPSPDDRDWTYIWLILERVPKR